MKVRFSANVRQKYVQMDKHVTIIATVAAIMWRFRSLLCKISKWRSCDKDSDCESGRCDGGMFFSECAAKLSNGANVITIATAAVGCATREFRKMLLEEEWGWLRL